MKKIALIIAMIFAGAAGYAQPNQNSDFDKLKWLTGTWKRTGLKPGQSGTETWSVTSATELTGKGITMRGADTVVVEKLSIIIKDNEIFYVADVTGSPKPVFFKMTSITADGFVCENPEHNFPKKIAYTRVDGGIHATISGDGKSVDYNFVKE